MRILFLCTGNTCRSPMAAALFSHMTGVAAESAGLCAAEGQPAAAHMKALAPAYHVNLDTHRSSPASIEMLQQADAVVCLSSAHAMQLSALLPIEKIRILGGGIADPFGGSLEDYRACAEQMQAAMPALIKELRCTCRIIPTEESHLPAMAALQLVVFHPPASEERLRERFAVPHAHMLSALPRDSAEGLDVNSITGLGLNSCALVGYIAVDEIADEAFIDDVAVFPQFQLQGIGNALLAQAETGAILRGCRTIHLEVRQSSGARALYAARGYKEVGRRKNFYQSPTEDAILMALAII